jgi:hypothetical protein
MKCAHYHSSLGKCKQKLYHSHYGDCCFFKKKKKASVGYEVEELDLCGNIKQCCYYKK